jgi:hypothetical protein
VSVDIAQMMQSLPLRNEKADWLDWENSSDDSYYGERYVKRREKMTIKGLSGEGLYFG